MDLYICVVTQNLVQKKTSVATTYRQLMVLQQHKPMMTYINVT